MAETREQREISTLASNLARHSGDARRDLDSDGLVSLHGVIPPEWLTAARADVEQYIARHGSGEHSLVNHPDRWECPHITELAVDHRVESFLHSLSALPDDASQGYAGYSQRVLRILDGSALDSPPFDWHYDANSISMLVPIVIPDDGSGQLALFPNHRPHRRSATLGAAERLLIHNKIYGRRLRRRYDSDPSAFTVPLTPGDAYLFRGYRSLHATLPWQPGTLRVTLLLQYGRPYGPDGALVQAIRARRSVLRHRRAGAGHP